MTPDLSLQYSATDALRAIEVIPSGNESAAARSITVWRQHVRVAPATASAAFLYQPLFLPKTRTATPKPNSAVEVAAETMQ